MTKGLVRVSVVIPTYNRADFLPEAIDSALSQDVGLEVILVDDGSVDNTPTVMQRYRDDSRVCYIIQQNQGQSVARNRGIAEAQGEFIAFLDSDNRWLPGKLKAELAIMDANPKVDVVYGDVISIDEQGRELHRYNLHRYSGRITPYMLVDNIVSMNTSLTRSAIFDELGAFNTQDRIAEDYELWLRLSVSCRFYYLPMFMCEYRIMANQLSSDKARRLGANESILLNFLKQYPGEVTELERKQGISRFYARKATTFFQLGDYAAGLKDLWRCCRANPLSLLPWKTLLRALLGRKGT